MSHGRHREGDTFDGAGSVRVALAEILFLYCVFARRLIKRRCRMRESCGVAGPLAAPDRRGADPGPRGVTHMTDLGAKT
jgi:hypothetical protein